MLPFIFQLQPFDLPRVSNDTACASDNNSKGAQHPFFIKSLVTLCINGLRIALMLIFGKLSFD